MPYDSVISRSNATALMPESVSREILQAVPQASAVMQMARRLPDIGRKTHRLPILNALAHAYFVDGDTGLKQTSNMEWADKYITAEELAVIVPIPEAVLDDADYDVWAEIRPHITEAFGRAFDAAVLFGTDAPASWPTNIKAAAVAASNSVALGAGDDLYDDLLSAGGVFAKVEADGYYVNGSIAALSMMASLRGLRDANGRPLFLDSMTDTIRYMLAGREILFPRNGGFSASAALLFAGDWSQVVWAVRQDLTYKILDQAVIQDASGNIIYNLAQQDMVALRATMRLGWQVPNPVNPIQATAGSRYPIGVLTP